MENKTLKEKQKEYGFKADEVFKVALADKIVKIIQNIPEDLERIDIVSTSKIFSISWKERKEEP